MENVKIIERKLLKKYGYENIESISEKKIYILLNKAEYKEIIPFLNKRFNLKYPTYKELFLASIINKKDLYSYISDIELGRTVILISEDLERYVKLEKLNHLFFIPVEYENIDGFKLIEEIKKFNFRKQLKEIMFLPFRLLFLPFIIVFCVVIYFLKKVTQEILYFLRIEERPINLYPCFRWGDLPEDLVFESCDKEDGKMLNFLDAENKWEHFFKTIPKKL